MFSSLDKTLENLLNNGGNPMPASLSILDNASISFITPDNNFVTGLAQNTVNLFLYEVKENRESRDQVPILEKVGDVYVSKRPPIRVDCVYIVTTWSISNGAVKVDEEHDLLAQSLLWLSRFPTIPSIFFQGNLLNQPFPPPTLVAQMDPNKNTAEFWSALGIPPRPAFYLVVTIAMHLGIQFQEGPPIVTKEITIKGIVTPGNPQPTLSDTYEIGGIVRNANTHNPISNAEVSILEKEWKVITDEEGHFNFSPLDAGNYTINVSASGFSTFNKAIVVPGTALNSYDINLST